MKKELADLDLSCKEGKAEYMRLNNKKSAKMNRVKSRINIVELEGQVQDPEENTKQVM